MSKIKLTKGELKRQRDGLQQFLHYLPILQLKKQQLQIRIGQAQRLCDEKKRAAQLLEEKILRWAGLLADPQCDITPWAALQKIITSTMNIAGIDIPVFEKTVYDEIPYDFYTTPLWIDQGIADIREYITCRAESLVIERQIEILSRELRITTQRVNLFEKVKIPQCSENIRLIRIYLGDRQANAVGISKVAKRKIHAMEEALAA